ncbi:MAG: hypothetical protein RR313_00085 [Anaerovoracaceae bacterium]
MSYMKELGQDIDFMVIDGEQTSPEEVKAEVKAEVQEELLATVKAEVQAAVKAEKEAVATLLDKSETDVNGFELDMSDVEGEDEKQRRATALAILAQEQKLLDIREAELQHDIKRKKIVRTIKWVIVILLAVVVLMAYTGGYRILLPASVVEHLTGIVNTAFEFAKQYFVQT